MPASNSKINRIQTAQKSKEMNMMMNERNSIASGGAAALSA
jgi:hypothetical protein